MRVCTYTQHFRDHVKSLMDHVAKYQTKATSPDLTDPRYMLIEAAEGGCLEDAPWEKNIAGKTENVHLTLLCCGVGMRNLR